VAAVSDVTGFPRVLVIGLGGTIAMTTAETGGVTPTLSARQLVDAVAGLADLPVDLETLSFRAKPGASLTIEDLVELIGVIRKAFGSGVAGVVVTQGTDTIEETAYALDLLHSGPQPVVVTGAMRNPTMAGADGPANLLAAVIVAASPAARELGCVVVMADEVHAARRVRKTHATSVSTFVSPNGGPLGYIAEGQVCILNQLPDRYTLPDPGHLTSEPRVALYTATLDDDGRILSAVAELADALVIAGFGVGHVPERWVPILADAARRMPVALTSRTGSGPSLLGTYGFPGSERDLISRGLISAGHLDPYKTRILLRLALAAGADHDRLRDAVAAAGGASASSWPWPAAPAGEKEQG
jgi:L-asparaginase